MLIPLNFEHAKNIAISVVKIPTGYSVMPCEIVDTSLNELSSFWANKKPYNDGITNIEPVAFFGFDPTIKYEGPDLYNCIQKIIKYLEEKYNYNKS